MIWCVSGVGDVFTIAHLKLHRTATNFNKLGNHKIQRHCPFFDLTVISRFTVDGIGGMGTGRKGEERLQIGRVDILATRLPGKRIEVVNQGAVRPAILLSEQNGRWPRTPFSRTKLFFISRGYQHSDTCPPDPAIFRGRFGRVKKTLQGVTNSRCPIVARHD